MESLNNRKFTKRTRAFHYSVNRQHPAPFLRVWLSNTGVLWASEILYHIYTMLGKQ